MEEGKTIEIQWWWRREDNRNAVMEEGRQWKCSGGGDGKTKEIQWLWRKGRQ